MPVVPDDALKTRIGMLSRVGAFDGAAADFEYQDVEAVITAAAL